MTSFKTPVSYTHLPIGPDEDAQALTVRLADLGAEALSEAVAAIGNGTAARTPQDESRQTYASMLTKEMCIRDRE